MADVRRAQAEDASRRTSLRSGSTLFGKCLQPGERKLLVACLRAQAFLLVLKAGALAPDKWAAPAFVLLECLPVAGVARPAASATRPVMLRVSAFTKGCTVFFDETSRSGVTRAMIFSPTASLAFSSS